MRRSPPLLGGRFALRIRCVSAWFVRAFTLHFWLPSTGRARPRRWCCWAFCGFRLGCPPLFRWGASGHSGRSCGSVKCALTMRLDSISSFFAYIELSSWSFSILLDWRASVKKFSLASVSCRLLKRILFDWLLVRRAAFCFRASSSRWTPCNLLEWRGKRSYQFSLIDCSLSLMLRREVSCFDMVVQNKIIDVN